MATGTPSSVAFGALGTLLGYVGAEVASDAIFSRLLWPQRFYDTLRPADLLAMAALMSLGGPIHKAALAALDRFISSGLNKGYCRGDMLGTAFYEDIQQTYTLRFGERKEDESQKEGRNGFWIRALRLIHWQRIGELNRSQESRNDQKDEEAAGRVRKLRARRPLMWLTLRYDRDRPGRGMQIRQSGSPQASSYSLKGAANMSRSIEDGSSRSRNCVLVGILASEITSLGVGIFVAVYWKSLFSLWFLSPLLVKLGALAFSVRRQPLEPISKDLGDPAQSLIITEMTDFSKGFILIEGPRHLITQFYRHYGHPERYRRGFNGDRFREIASMVLVVSCILIFPAGLVAFVFAPQSVQWTWLGYQLYTTVAMHLFRFMNGESIGSTENGLARQLQKGKPIRFCDSEGTPFLAQLDLQIANSIAEGRRKIDERLETYIKTLL